MPTKINTQSLTVDEVSYQYNFYDKILPSDVHITYGKNTDGYIPGTLFEHKNNVSSVGRAFALSQALIYLTRFNRDGMPVPKNIMLVSQSENKVYLYDSSDYLNILNDVETYATKKASAGIPGLREAKPPKIITYDLNNAASCQDLVKHLTDAPEYTKVDITEHNVYGWATRFYKQAAKPKKVELFKELRNPSNVLAGFINPWRGKETDFSLIMDLLNDPLQQKRLGAFYTPPEYAEKTLELLRKAIARVPAGNDYVIIDRCAGTGALEIGLSDEELSHTIVSTYELKEWYVLKDRLGNLVRCVIPPVPAPGTKYPPYDKDTGFLSGANALDESFIDNPEIQKYVQNPKCSIILLENPPYRDSSSSDKTEKESNKDSYVATKFKEDRATFNEAKGSHRDISNLLIWSGFKYYLRQPTDSYVLLAPVKYFKSIGLANKKFLDGFLFNRKHFHASPSAISCILWSNVDDATTDSFPLHAYDIVDDELKYSTTVTVRKAYKTLHDYFDKSSYPGDQATTVWLDGNGKEVSNRKCDGVSIYNPNIIGYLRPIGFNLGPLNGYLVRHMHYGSRGFYLRRSNFLTKMPLFCAKSFPHNKWYETDIYFTTADGGLSYVADKDFLKRCLIWSCITGRNKCRTLQGSDGRLYQNELCFDGNTAASDELATLQQSYPLTDTEVDLLRRYSEILTEVRRVQADGTPVYPECPPSNYKLGLFQINDEINVRVVTGYDRHGKPKKEIKYGDLNNMISELKRALRDYYDESVLPGLFKHQLLK